MDGKKALAAAQVYVDDTLKGEGAIKGKDGKNGESAYAIAVKNGFSGTEAEWLESLKGKDGTNGKNGSDGKDGENGASAYEIAVKDGYSGTETEWLESLKGKDGKDGQGAKISTEDGNALKKSTEDGGLYVPSSAVKYSADEKNIAKAGSDGGIFVPETDLTGYAKSADVVAKETGKGLSTNDYDNTAKSKVGAIPENPKYTDTVYDDTAIKTEINKKADATSVPKVSDTYSPTSADAMSGKAVSSALGTKHTIEYTNISGQTKTITVYGSAT